MLEGLSYLHEAGIMHRDIKCANVLVGADGVIKLADFGASKAVEGGKTMLDGQQLNKTITGTPDVPGRMRVCACGSQGGKADGDG